ncbi:ubiquitin carboxyl-terminal hydrolase 19 [Apiospora marii]|uniref:ubiquitin carboxyl-terminal hydrolase 19 n=1 Tax=Apiospora marii TaxID=335849 RepID=UPI003131452C
MDSRFPVSREELYSVQMDVKQLHLVQNSHAERLQRLEKRQADDAALKSVWNSPFPSALGGTPQHGAYLFTHRDATSDLKAVGPMQMPTNDLFDDFEEQGQNLLGSLHLDAEDEPARRGAASRANSVRFDESALQSSSWAQNGRHSGDFGPIRPGSGMGNMMERSLSHKSDGRHSSAGHSVHSVHSHHSMASGHASSLGLDTTFATTGTDEDSPVGVPELPPGFMFLGSVPSIVRCWLTPNFAHDTLLYAVVCSGSQHSSVEYSLVKELDLLDEIHRDLDGVQRLRLPVYLAEATVTQPNSRAASPGPQMPEVPSLMANFEVIGSDQAESAETKKGIQIFIGSENLREHSADILLSQNRMVLYGTEREKLSVPFVRPEDNGVFKHIRTLAVIPEKPKLNATARPFVFAESKQGASEIGTSNDADKDASTGPDSQGLASPDSEVPKISGGIQGVSTASESGTESDRQAKEIGSNQGRQSEGANDSQSESQSESQRRESTAGGIWSSWRQGTSANGNDSKENMPLSGYQPPGRARNMKVLKPSKASTSTSARTGASYEPPRTSSDRRKSQPLGEGASAGTVRWKPDRAVSISGLDSKQMGVATPRESRNAPGAPRTAANPVGGASAFAWMSRPKTPATATD